MQNPPPTQQGYNTPYGSPPNAPLSSQPGGAGGSGGKSSTGLDANVAALLSYVLTLITGVIFYVIEKENRFVRFHAMQAILLGGSILALSIVLTVVLTILTMISWVLGTLASLIWLVVSIGFLAVWIICMIKAFQGQMFKLPVIGDMAENIINK